MTDIRPFRGIIYNQRKIQDLSAVVCPPYDVISPQRQEFFLQRSPYNLIHILLGEDIPGDDKYRRAAKYFKQWSKDGILIQDEKESIYFYSHQYNLKGEKKTRLGFLALLRLDDRKASVYAHEHTRLEAKEDRFKLIRAVKTNLSPIFVVFADKKRIIPAISKDLQAKMPFVDIVDDEKNIHKVWRLDQPELLHRIRVALANENIFIADGHHRYEVACAYRQELEKSIGQISESAGFNYIMAYFTSTESNSLTILPIHRLVKLNAPLSEDRLGLELKAHFDMEEVRDKTKFFFLMEKAGRSEHALGMYMNHRYWLLRLKNIKLLDKIIADKPADYRSLDVAILNHVVLEGILKLDLDDKARITFNNDAEELIRGVDSDDSCMAFFLNPVKMQQIISVALSGEKMPPKSTYFYPKVLSGLVINRLEVD